MATSPTPGPHVHAFTLFAPQWDLLEGDFGLHLKEHHASLARIRSDSPELKGEELDVLHADEEGGLLFFRRGFGEGAVLVVVNFHDTDRSVTVPFVPGRWRELTFGYDADTGDTLVDTLPASSVKIFAPRAS
ncbi:MAG: DUF3459 domain-containing protein [Polyangiaceae bacterium]